MARSDSVYVCQSCGAVHSKWAGKCDDCGQWNTLVEEKPAESAPKGLGNARKGRKIEFVGLKGDSPHPPRWQADMVACDATLRTRPGFGAGEPGPWPQDLVPEDQGFLARTGHHTVEEIPGCAETIPTRGKRINSLSSCSKVCWPIWTHPNKSKPLPFYV